MSLAAALVPSLARFSRAVRLGVAVAAVVATLAAFGSSPSSAAELRMPLAEYRDRMAAGWVGQMAGVAVGGPTEFRWNGKTVPANALPTWKPEMINQFGQDDIYVEMTFLGTLEKHGLDASIRQAGIDFANSGYRLWHANLAGRNNLRQGIAPPDSGHPKFNTHADDIDYQIEADYSGLIAPGMPNAVIALGEKFGRLMNYGDGLYGGQFVGGMYAAAFFEDDPVKIIEAGLACIPAESQYAQCIGDVLAWHAANKTDWQATWKQINTKYHLNDAYRLASCNLAQRQQNKRGDANIDAKINGAFIVMGLLYGNRDPHKTIAVATRCGLDSDCNPSSAAGILFTTIGLSKLPGRFTSALDREAVFSHTDYSFNRLVKVCEALVRQIVVREGGRIERGADGEEMLVIAVRSAKPIALEQSWQPGPVAGSRFTEAERRLIQAAAEGQ